MRLLTYLIAALARLDQRIGQQARALLRAVQGSDIERVLTSLINDLVSYLTQDVVLILDDYHLITVPAVHQALLFLLDHMPQRLHLILGTRTDPPLPLARLRARGQLNEVRGEDLRFAPAEATAFLREMGLELNSDELRAEGWIAGIQLLALALRGRTSSAELLGAFASSHRFLTDYLSDEVLQRQPAELRDFLLRTSVLERLCGPLCDALTGRSDGQVMLAELRRTNLFLSVLDNSEQWYRYHPLFAAALRELLQRQESGLAAELYHRAGVWYEQQDLLSQAIEYALRAGDQALTTLEQAPVLAEPQGYLRMFADEGEPMARLLVRLATLPQKAGSATPGYIQTLLAAIEGSKAFLPGDTSAVPGSTFAPHSLSLVEPLTPREQEVLTLLASGASNQAIADALIITPNTAKRHVKHILSKLGVANRIQAVARARELNLL